jgi:phenylalanyl-tRNA synthetase beta chain
MKFTLSWLKEHLETEASLETIVDTLTNIGLEVEDVSDRTAELAPFTVARVVEARQHPDADRLKVCVVDTGSETVEVVCGAPNAHTGMYGVFAPVGSVLPGTGDKLKAAKIRGVPSNGMLCSERELGLSDEHEGIIELAEAPLGEPFAKYAGLADPAIEIAITPNRQDCLGVGGVARDLAAAGIGRLRDRTPDPVAGSFESPLGVELEFDPDTAAACPYFVGRYIRGVKNGPSPAWLQQRLKAIGLRPISALVDMTNYITFDRARPLHVFDPDQVAGKIRVRLARTGEKVDALNDKSYTLDDQVTVIADDEGAHAMGGVIGGVSTGCTEDTTNVFIEAALFDSMRTAATGRRYQIESDARYRFERGVDPAAVVAGIEAATLLVLELCGGEASELVFAGAEPDWQKNVTLRPGRIKALGGIELSDEEITNILESLGFGVSSQGEVFSVSVPSWRSDVDGEADLVEEVTRIHGYHRVPAVPLDTGGRVTHPALTPVQRRGPWATRALAARGLQEVVTWSFTSAAWLDLFGGVREDLRLANPISSELDVMRPSLLPNLIVAAGRNVDRGAHDLGLFEVGPSWRDPTPEGQDRVAAGLRRGRNGPRHWLEEPRAVDAFDAKADALAALEAAGAPVASLQVAGEAPSWYHPGRSGTLRLGPKSILAAFGEVHPRVLDRLGVKGPLVAFEANLSAVPAPRAKASRTRPVLDTSDLPFVDRDFAFVVTADEPAGNLVRAARGADKALIVDVSVFDVFEGPALGEGKKSIAIRVRLQPRKQTLTESEIEATSQKVVTAVAKATGGELRT